MLKLGDLLKAQRHLHLHGAMQACLLLLERSGGSMGCCAKAIREEVRCGWSVQLGKPAVPQEPGGNSRVRGVPGVSASSETQSGERMYKAALIWRYLLAAIFSFTKSILSSLAPSLVICLYTNKCVPPPPLHLSPLPHCPQNSKKK